MEDGLGDIRLDLNVRRLGEITIVGLRTCRDLDRLRQNFSVNGAFTPKHSRTVESVNLGIYHGKM